MAARACPEAGGGGCPTRQEVGDEEDWAEWIVGQLGRLQVEMKENKWATMTVLAKMRIER
jgi:hypothetical protein